MSLRISEEEDFRFRKSFELKQEDKWTTVKSLGAICQGRYGHTAIRVANQWIIFGGRGPHGYLNDLYTFDFYTSFWKKIQTSSDIPKRCLHSASLINNNEDILIFGNFHFILIFAVLLIGGHHGETYYNDTWILRIKNMECEQCEVKGNIPAGRQGHTAITKNNVVFIFGGLGLNGVYFNDLYTFDYTKRKWSKIIGTGNIPATRHLHSSLYYEDKMIIFGGKNDSYLSDVYEFDIETSIWTQVEPFGDHPSPRYGHTSIMIYGTMIISGGYSSDYYLNEVYALDLESYTWTKYKTNEDRPKLYHHRSTLHGDFMYTFGGHNGSYLNEVFQLDLTQEKHQLSKLKHIYSLYQNDLFSDISVKIDNEEFNLHLCIVSQNQLFCKYFLEDDLKISISIFKNMIRYLYGSKILIKNLDELFELYKHSLQFEMYDLENICLFHCKRMMNFKNVFEIFETSNELKFDRIKNLALNYINENQLRNTLNLMNEDVKKIKISSYINRNLNSHIELLYDTKEFSDIILRTKNNEKIYCHKAIIGRFSEFFKTMFQAGFQESFEKEVEMNEIDFNTLEILIKFTYGKSVQFPNSIQELLQLVRFSDIYFLDELNQRATNEISKLITLENALDIINFCLKYGIEGSLKENCWQVIKFSGGKDQLLECLFEMNLSNMFDHQQFKNLEQNIINQKIEFSKEIEKLKEENGELKKIINEQNEMLIEIKKQMNEIIQKLIK
eukprot:gene12708-6906_t